MLAPRTDQKLPLLSLPVCFLHPRMLTEALGGRKHVETYFRCILPKEMIFMLSTLILAQSFLVWFFWWRLVLTQKAPKQLRPPVDQLGHGPRGGFLRFSIIQVNKSRPYVLQSILQEFKFLCIQIPGEGSNFHHPGADYE